MVTGAIILANELVFVEFPRNHGIIDPLFNTRSNAPWGLLTAVFTPDPQVFLCYTGKFQASNCYAYFMSWFAVTAGNLVLSLALFLVVNLNHEAHERGVRSVFYGIAIIAISALSNLVDLVRGIGSAGPSTAIYAGIGIVLGFSLANTAGLVWIRRCANLRSTVAIAVSLATTLGLLVMAGAYPADFFNASSTLKVEVFAHELCFLLGTLISFVFAFRGRQTLKSESFGHGTSSPSAIPGRGT